MSAEALIVWAVVMSVFALVFFVMFVEDVVNGVNYWIERWKGREKR